MRTLFHLAPMRYRLHSLSELLALCDDMHLLAPCQVQLALEALCHVLLALFDIAPYHRAAKYATGNREAS